MIHYGEWPLLISHAGVCPSTLPPLLLLLIRFIILSSLSPLRIDYENLWSCLRTSGTTAGFDTSPLSSSSTSRICSRRRCSKAGRSRTTSQTLPPTALLRMPQVCLSICMYACLYVCLSVCLSVYVRPSFLPPPQSGEILLTPTPL